MARLLEQFAEKNYTVSSKPQDPFSAPLNENGVDANANIENEIRRNIREAINGFFTEFLEQLFADLASLRVRAEATNEAQNMFSMYLDYLKSQVLETGKFSVSLEEDIDVAIDLPDQFFVLEKAGSIISHFSVLLNKLFREVSEKIEILKRDINVDARDKSDLEALPALELQREKNQEKLRRLKSQIEKHTDQVTKKEKSIQKLKSKLEQMMNKPYGSIAEVIEEFKGLIEFLKHNFWISAEQAEELSHQLKIEQKKLIVPFTVEEIQEQAVGAVPELKRDSFWERRKKAIIFIIIFGNLLGVGIPYWLSKIPKPKELQDGQIETKSTESTEEIAFSQLRKKFPGYNDVEIKKFITESDDEGILKLFLEKYKNVKVGDYFSGMASKWEADDFALAVSSLATVTKIESTPEGKKYSIEVVYVNLPSFNHIVTYTVNE